MNNKEAQLGVEHPLGHVGMCILHQTSRDLGLGTQVRGKGQNKDGNIGEVIMFFRSISMEIVIPSSNKPPFLMITKTHDRKFEGVIPTGRDREAEAAKIATHVASAIMYRLVFGLDAEPDDIAEFIQIRSSGEHVKVATKWLSSTRQVTTTTTMT